MAKTIAAFLGAVVFAKISAAKCFPWCMGVGIVSALLGVAQRAFGPVGILAVLIACVAYLFALGLFANKRS